VIAWFKIYIKCTQIQQHTQLFRLFFVGKFVEGDKVGSYKIRKGRVKNKLE